MTRKKDRIRDGHETSEALSKAIDRRRPVWPILISSMLGFISLLLLFLPMLTLKRYDTDAQLSVSFINMMVGNVDSYGHFNIWYGCDFIIFILGYLFPLFGGRTQKKWTFIVGTCLQIFGVLLFLVLPVNAICDYSFHLNRYSIADSFDNIGFIVFPCVSVLFWGLPWVMRAYSTRLAIKSFDKFVKTGKKLLNY